MIAVSEDRIVLVHCHGDQSAGAAAEQGDTQETQLGEFDATTWYCQWTAQHVRPLYLLLSERGSTRLAPACSRFGEVEPLWYSDDTAPKLPETRRGQLIWIVNGGQSPLIDWDASALEVRRQRADVLVFGPSHRPLAGHYLETLRVNDDGEVVRFNRHYFDSPSSADPSVAPASFIVTAGRHARAVVAHILRFGWGLASIGALVRRFNVRWSDDTCVTSRLELARTGADVACQDQHVGVTAVDRQSAAPATLARGRPPSNDHAAAMGSDAAAVASTPAALADPSDQNPADARTPLVPVAPRANTGVAELAAALEDVPVATRAGHAYVILKRIMDLFMATIALVLLSPLMLVVAVLVKLTSRGPVLFGHRRQGMGGKEFRCWKFRTMIHGADAMQDDLRQDSEVDGPQFKIEQDPRLTSIGDWLRRLNIDELPQLFNVALGQMSFVGPRPSPDRENQLCPGWRRTRLSMRPGITGLWQVLRLRETASSGFQQWIYYDVEYARHRSIWLDLQIMLHTPVAMFAPGHLKRFARSLERRGICVHSGRLSQEAASRLMAAATQNDAHTNIL